MIPGIDNDIRALEECRRSNDHEIGRLSQLCTALMQRETQSTNASEIDSIRNEISKYRDQISNYQSDNARISVKLRELSDMSGA